MLQIYKKYLKETHEFSSVNGNLGKNVRMFKQINLSFEVDVYEQPINKVMKSENTFLEEFPACHDQRKLNVVQSPIKYLN